MKFTPRLHCIPSWRENSSVQLTVSLLSPLASAFFKSLGVTHLELGADARRLLLLVQVQQRLGDAVGQRQVAQVLERLDVEQMLRTRGTVLSRPQ